MPLPTSCTATATALAIATTTKDEGDDWVTGQQLAVGAKDGWWWRLSRDIIFLQRVVAAMVEVFLELCSQFVSKIECVLKLERSQDEFCVCEWVAVKICLELRPPLSRPDLDQI